jgi:hypothetical protein
MDLSRGKFAHICDGPQRIEDTHPPIIDRELWEKVKAVRLRSRVKAIQGPRPKNGAHLSGLMRCGRCGGAMFATSRKDHYVCGAYHEQGVCSHNTIGFEQAIKLVAQKLRSVLLGGSMEALTSAIQRKLIQRKKAKTVEDAGAIKRQIAELDRKLEAAAERLLAVESALVKAVHAAMQKLKMQRDALASKLELIGTQRKELNAEQIAANLWKLDEVLTNGDPLTIRAKLSEIVEKIVVDFTPQAMANNPARVRYVASGMVLHFYPDCGTLSSRRW